MSHCTGQVRDARRIPSSCLLHSVFLAVALRQGMASSYPYSQCYTDLCSPLSHSPFFQAGKLITKTSQSLHCFCCNSYLVLSPSVLVLVLRHLHSLCSSAYGKVIVKIVLLFYRTVVTQWSTSITIKAIWNALFSQGLAKDWEKQQFHISRTRENSSNVNKNKPMVLSTFFSYLFSNTDWLKPFPFRKLPLSTSPFLCKKSELMGHLPPISDYFTHLYA